VSGSFDLQRFVQAQETNYASALSELQAGRKRSHWMWYIFPQLRGLGSSPTSLHYSISSTAEARAYWSHSILGPRLAECTQAVLNLQNRSVEEIFGYPDDLKFRSCMTLFDASVQASDLFSRALQKYYGGERDPATVELLGR